MVDPVKIFLLTCLTLIFATGTTLNLLTIYVLLFNRTLCEKVAAVRWLMLGEAVVDLLVCCIGVPDMFGNVLVGEAPPYTTVPFLCHINELLGFGMSYVSIWYQTTIALSRVAAIMAPNFYRHRLSRPLATVVMVSWPWFMGYILYVIGAATKSFAIYPTPGTGTCVANQYDASPEAARRMAAYLYTDTALHAWLPMLLGLLCYVSIYTRRFLIGYRAKRKTESTIALRVVKFTDDNVKTATPSVRPQQVGSDMAASAFGATTVMAGKNAATSTHQHATIVTAAAKSGKRKKKNDEREKKIKLLAISFVVYIVLTFPLMGFAWGFDYYTYYSETVPFLARLLDVMYFMAFPTTPIIYVLVSTDFRLAFRQVFIRKVALRQ